MNTFPKQLLLATAILVMAALGTSFGFSQFIGIKIAYLETVSWYGNVTTVGAEIEKLRFSSLALFLSPKQRARVQGLIGDLEMSLGHKEAAAERYTEELFGLLKAADPAAHAKLRANPDGILSLIGPETPPASLLAVNPFDPSGLTRHAPAEIPAGRNAHEMAREMPAILHHEELQKIIQAGPVEFATHSQRAAELLNANQQAIAAFSRLADEYRHYRCPEASEFLRLDRAANLFMLRFLAAWRSGDGLGMVDSHRRALQMAELAADDGSLMTSLVHIALRSTLTQHGEALLSLGLTDDEIAGGMRRNLKEFPFDRDFLNGVAAKEFISARAMTIAGLDSILKPGEGLSTVTNFREQWIHDYEEELFAQMSLLHQSLTELGKAENLKPVRAETILADALHSGRPAIYWRYPHSCISETEANLIRTYAAARCSARIMGCIAAPNTGKIMETVAKLEASEAALVAALEAGAAQTNVADKGR